MCIIMSDWEYCRVPVWAVCSKEKNIFLENSLKDYLVLGKSAYYILQYCIFNKKLYYEFINNITQKNCIVTIFLSIGKVR